MIKSRTGDFRVTERLAEGYLEANGPFAVYRVRKRKLTSFDAAAELAELAGVPREAVSFAGLKDRQGVTTQYMSVEGGKPVSLASQQLSIELVGRATGPLESGHSLGNEFEVVVRDVRTADLPRIREAAALARECGVPNYFDEQRFGNIRHGQGWIARDLMMGRREQALKRLIASDSPHDDDRTKRLKRALRDHWRDWKKCRNIAGKLGAHHSVFEHLARDPRDYAGAFRRVASRIRLIHLFAYQSHLWNRAAVAFLRERLERDVLVDVPSIEGPLVFPAQGFRVTSSPDYTLRLPGPHLADVGDPQQKRLYEELLRSEGLSKRSFDIEGIPGFALKGEDRPLFVFPEIAPIREETDRRATASGRHSGRTSIKLRFALPRGAYATIVVKRLLAGTKSAPYDSERPKSKPERRTHVRKPKSTYAPKPKSPWGSGSDKRGGPNRTNPKNPSHG